MNSSKNPVEYLSLADLSNAKVTAEKVDILIKQDEEAILKKQFDFVDDIIRSIEQAINQRHDKVRIPIPNNLQLSIDIEVIVTALKQLDYKVDITNRNDLKISWKLYMKKV